MRDSPSYWSVSNLELSHAGQGISVNYTSAGHEGLRFTNLYVHDVDKITFGQPQQSDFAIYTSGAITISATAGSFTLSPGQYYLRDVVIDGVEGYKTSPVAITGLTPDGLNVGTSDDGAIQDVVIKNSYFHVSTGAYGFQSVTNLKIISTWSEADSSC